MQITIDVPGVACSRCPATAPLQPTVLRRAAATSGPSVFVATDSTGQTWAVMAQTPTGWLEIVDGAKRLLCCPACAAAFKAFLQPAAAALAPSSLPGVSPAQRGVGAVVIDGSPTPAPPRSPIPQNAPQPSRVAVMAPAAAPVHIAPAVRQGATPPQVHRVETAKAPLTSNIPLPPVERPGSVVHRTLVAEPPEPAPPPSATSGEVVPIQRRT